MRLSSGHWYPVLSSRELRTRPIARVRFGEKLVFWRDTRGAPVCMRDRCAHRGAALSLGRVQEDSIECPFHGFRYNREGRCVRMPAEAGREIPADCRVAVQRTHEEDGYVWVWRGPPLDDTEKPPVPAFEHTAGLRFAEHQNIWPAHYTRCIENVCDYSHLYFVHRKNLGLMLKEPVTQVMTNDFDGGFRAYRQSDGVNNHYIEFRYPNLWLNDLGRTGVVTCVFVPVDEHRTQVYYRTFFRPALAPLAPLLKLWTRLSQFVVFRDDWPIIATQDPVSVDDAQDEKLFPADSPVIAYRRLRRQHRQST